MALEGHQTLSTLLDAYAPGSTALVHQGRRWTYAELADAADALSAAMSELAGDRVAVMLPNCPEAVVTYLACFRTGAVATPLNTRYAPPEIERALRRARPRWLVIDASRMSRLAGVDPGVLSGTRILVVGRNDRYEQFAALLSAPEEVGAAALGVPAPGPDQPGVLFFTSGSTGVPKGVVHSHRSALAMLTSTAEAMGNVTDDDVMQVCDPLMHVSGFIETLTTLLAGGTVVLYDGFDRDGYLAGLRTYRPTLICTHIDVLAQVVRGPDVRRDWFSSLRGVYTGGDTVPAALQRNFTAHTGRTIGVGYGLTEAIWLTVNREPRVDRDGCIGRPVGGAQIRADETTGELLVRGPMVMTGYWEDETLTRESMSDGWLRTGDLGSQDADGVWWFEGRTKDLIVRRTSKITPGEVESAIDRHPDVVSSAVVAAPDPDEGEVPVAFVVRRNGHRLSADDLMGFLRGRIAEYKLPTRIHFRTALPLTASGKIAHHDLRESA